MRMARTPSSTAERVVVVLERLLGAPVPWRVRAWDGSVAGTDDGPVVVVSSRRAVRRLLWQPDELGLARAWVAGELEVEGDLEEAVRRLLSVDVDLTQRRVLSPAERSEIVRAAVLLGAVGPQPRPPAEEASLVGDRDSRGRDTAAAQYHDAGSDFFRVLLGPSLTYTSDGFAPGDERSLEQAQADALDDACRALRLHPGSRLLDLGCGWGALLEHAAVHYRIEGVGVTLSREQAEHARKRLARAGVADRVEVRVGDWRHVDDGPYDAVAAVDAAGPAGSGHWADVASRAHDLLAPGGVVHVRQTVRRPGPARPGGAFVRSFVLPERRLHTLAELVDGLERADLEVRAVENRREHHAATLRRWAVNLDAGMASVQVSAGVGRARAWRLFLAGSALAADLGWLGATRVTAVRRHADGSSAPVHHRPVA